MHRYPILIALFFVTACSEPTYQGSQGNVPQIMNRDEFSVTTSDGHTVFGNLYRPNHGTNRMSGVADSASFPLILAFHQGGASGAAEYEPIIPRLLEAGFAVMTIDQRRGGERFMGQNRTAEAFNQDTVSYCEVIEDLEASLAYAVTLDEVSEIIAWGSSYSATLAVKLAVNHPELISRVLAFSPASGQSMVGCSVLPLAFQVRQPALFLRPQSEMSFGSVAADLAAFANMGHDTYIASPGAHGSSMLVASRVEGETAQTWSTVIRFLKAR